MRGLNFPTPIHRRQEAKAHPGRRLRAAILQLFVAALLMTSASVGQAGQLPLSQTPLFVTTAVSPNVMLLIDNSGSMDNIVWADEYDNTNAYPNWGGAKWSATTGNVFLRDVTTCTGGRQGSKGTEKRCLKLPDPVGSGNTRYSGNYLNYLFETYADGTDLTDGKIPTETRMQVAKTVARELVKNTSGVRFGVARFDGSSSTKDPEHWLAKGARVDAACGTDAETIRALIGGYAAEMNTPLAEAYYELTRYFRGMSSYYRAGVTHTSPLQYRCQKNFIIVITDGLPTRDADFPDDDPADLADESAALPNWDNLAPATTTSQYPNFPQYSDGFNGEKGTDTTQEGYALYLDDLAKFGYDIDLKTGGTDDAGVSWDDSSFPKQRIETYTVGFATDNQMLEDAAHYGNGIYYKASNAAMLTSALSGAIADIESKTASAAAVAINSRSLNTNSRLYQALFTTGTWSGDLVSYPIMASGDVDTSPASTMSAKARLANVAWNQRQIITRNAGGGIPFDWVTSGDEALTDNMQALLNYNPVTNAVDNEGEARLRFLRGDSTNEGTGLNFRTRTGGFKLGDISNSGPLYVGAPIYVPEIEDAAHKAFRDAYAGRREMVYVGANDGMLHGFTGDTLEEKIAYVPSFIFDDPANPASPNYANGPHHLTNPGYGHRYYVDGSPAAADAYGMFDNVDGTCSTGCWRTVLVSGVGGGGKGYFALDITDPEGDVESTAALAFSENNASKIALWEFTDSASGDMGFTYGEATIAKVRVGSNSTRWAAIFGNGYNSTNERAYLYVVDVVTSEEIAKILLPDPAAEPFPPLAVPTTKYGNGLSTPAVVDKDGDYIADYVYAGDLRGNLWKIDLTSSNPDSWGSFYKNGSKYVPLYTAIDASGNRLPITGRPEVGAHPAGIGGFMIYFGSGRYLTTTDNDPTATPVLVNAFHGIWDEDTSASASAGELQAVPLSRLRTQTISTDTVAGQTIRTVTDWQITSWSNSGSATSCNSSGARCMGWIVNLPTTGERQISNPVLLGGVTPRIIFTSLVPDNTPCNFGGIGWLMELNPMNGGRLNAGVFDLDGDGVITSADLSGGTVPVAGINPGIGILPDPVIMRDPANKQDLKLLAGSTGAIASVKNHISKASGGRQSWRQLK